jgi:hypothetical protein
MTLNCKKENEKLKSDLLEDHQKKFSELEQAHIKSCNNEKNELENAKDSECESKV